MTQRFVQRWIRASLIGIILGSVSAAFCQTNLIKNGSFERPVVPYRIYRLFSTGHTFSHWRVVGDAGNVAVANGTVTIPPVYSFPAQAGSQFLDLTGVSNTATGVAQTVATTPNASYTLTFYVGNTYDPNGPNNGVSSTVNVLVDDQQVFQATNSTGKGRTALTWQKFTTTIVATSSQTTIAFINGDPSTDNINGLDAVSLVPQSK